METLPRGRRSRRSSSNLHLSNISPITTHFSLTAVDSPENDDGRFSFSHSSYIQGVSAPATPSILSRAPSTKRPYKSFAALPVSQRPLSHTASLRPLSKSKSSGYLVQDSKYRIQSYVHTRQQARGDESSEWIHRAGVALTSGTRESKGQSWLVSRASSTSLVERDLSDDDETVKRQSSRTAKLRSEIEQAGFADNHISSVQERVYSQASLKGNGQQLYSAHQGQYPLAPDFIDEALMVGSFDGDENIIHDVFDADDEEDLHWSRRQRTGLGVWVDRLMGWTMFSVGEEEDVSDEEGCDTKEEDVRRSRRRIAPQRVKIADPKEEKELVNADESESGWQDAAWMFAIASKVLL